jgi:hypothetical protein
MTRLEKTATASVVFSFLLLLGIVTRGYIRDRNQALAAAPLVKIGDVVNLPDFPSAKDRSTLVLVLSSGCHYCMDSLPFYKQLAAFRKSRADKMRLLAVLPEDKNSARTFLESAGVFTDGVLSKPPSELGARIVPTLLLLDREGRLQQYWAGELNPASQEDVLDALRRSCADCDVASTPESDDSRE